MMPKSVDNFPLFFSKKERGLLKGCSLLNLIDQENINIKKDYDLICKEVMEFKIKFTLQEYKEARTLVKSKAFSIEVEGMKTYGLIPFADILNHKNGSK